MNPGLMIVGFKLVHSFNKNYSASCFVVRYSGKNGGAFADETRTKFLFCSSDDNSFSSLAILTAVSLFIALYVSSGSFLLSINVPTV